MRSIRDIHKQVTHDEARDILGKAEYGVLSTIDKDGYPYGLPLHHILLDDAIYLHCALEGHIMDTISANNKVCFTVVGYSELLPSSFTANYESVIAFGKANLVEEAEKVDMLKALVRKYSPEYYDKGMKVIDSFKDKCSVIRIDIEHITGKKKR
ncbi:MAG: Pyridoxamine 5-phosphate oxidase-related protein [Clostridia bacterium]|jgi:nitroimidazol reductase NimA-like FMN-containing flavoprotein (pyridoxamine 5'-phosphate oxidase superfamily)|nr:Pyridoxamine 5-phosphate oxidase-related protein [Clostridia bacterium]